VAIRPGTIVKAQAVVPAVVVVVFVVVIVGVPLTPDRGHRLRHVIIGQVIHERLVGGHGRDEVRQLVLRGTADVHLAQHPEIPVVFQNELVVGEWVLGIGRIHHSRAGHSDGLERLIVRAPFDLVCRAAPDEVVYIRINGVNDTNASLGVRMEDDQMTIVFRTYVHTHVLAEPQSIRFVQPDLDLRFLYREAHGRHYAGHGDRRQGG
jgi:hypothetical protein